MTDVRGLMHRRAQKAEGALRGVVEALSNIAAECPDDKTRWLAEYHLKEIQKAYEGGCDIPEIACHMAKDFRRRGVDARTAYKWASHEAERLAQSRLKTFTNRMLGK